MVKVSLILNFILLLFTKFFLPSFAGNNAHFTALAIFVKNDSLPPFIVAGVRHVQNVTKFKA